MRRFFYQISKTAEPDILFCDYIAKAFIRGVHHEQKTINGICRSPVEHGLFPGGRDLEKSPAPAVFMAVDPGE